MPYDRPRKDELLSAVREFMESKLLPELKGHLNFNTRVAVNVLKIVERELLNGDSISQQAHIRLLQLLEEENISGKLDTLDNHQLNRLLSEKIENGKLDYHSNELLEHLWQTTLDKISIDNPKYASYQKEITN